MIIGEDKAKSTVRVHNLIRLQQRFNTVLKGYIDESGNDEIFCLSCLLGKGANWDFFQGDWDDVIAKTNASLKAEGRPEISRYHAAECSSLVGEFDGWNKDEQITLTKSLLKVFEKPANALTVVGYTIDLGLLVQEVPETSPDPTGFAYALLIKCLMGEIGDMLVESNGYASGFAVPLVHDRSRCDAILRRSFDGMKQDPNFKYSAVFPTLVPMGWEDCPQLQAADLLAYENFKEHERRTTNRKRRKTLEHLLEDESSFGGRSKGFDAKGIAALKSFVTDDIRDQILSEANIRKGAQ